MILDYSSFKVSEQNDIYNFCPNHPLVNGSLAEIENYIYEYSYINCPYCNSYLLTPIKNIGWGYLELVKHCSKCGWWCHEFEQSISTFGSSDEVNFGNVKFTQGILKKYNDESKSIPVDILRKELIKRNELVYNINPYKFEELVGSVFRDFFNCEVKHVGKSNDGGIDLVLIRTDSDVVIQVKRRTKPNTTEGVSVIRELIGAMMLAEKKNGIFVTTADTFSKQAIKSSEKVRTLGVVENIDLIDYKKFIDIMGLIKKNDTNLWEKFVINDEKILMPKIYFDHVNKTR